MECRDSLLLRNSPIITLKKIARYLSSIDEEEVIGDIKITLDQSYKMVNWILANGDYREGLSMVSGDNKYRMFFGANRCNSNPDCISFGKEEDGVYYLAREIFDNIYRKTPKLLKRDLFILSEKQIYSKKEMFGYAFDDLKDLSSDKELYLSKILESLDTFERYFLIRYFKSSEFERSNYNLGDLSGINIEKILKGNETDLRQFYESVADNMLPNERQLIINTLQCKSCSTCTNVTCQVETSEKIGVDEFGHPQGYSCIGWTNDELIGKCKVLGKNN